MELDATFPSPFPTNDPILGLIGNTPMIPYPGPGVDNLFCKLETENPTRSMKDRVAMGILTEALADGDYDRVVEASSGNTAGAVALVCNRLNIDCTVTCPSTTSAQKIGYMRAYGATVRLCPKVDADHPDHYRATARRLAGGQGRRRLDQRAREDVGHEQIERAGAQRLRLHRRERRCRAVDGRVAPCRLLS